MPSRGDGFDIIVLGIWC